MRLTETEQQIVDLMKEQEYLLQPSEIAEKTGLNPSTVRVSCTKLQKKGYLYRPIPGFYKFLSPYGDANMSGLRVHDLRLSAEVPGLRGAVKRPDVAFVLNGAEVVYQFGKRHGKFSVSVSHGRGLDYFGLMRVLARVEEDAMRFFGIELEYECSFHLNRDLRFLRLDRFQSVTIGDLGGCFRRIYQKGDDVRVEVGVSKASLDELVDLVTTEFNLTSFCFSIRKSLVNVEKTVKEINRKVGDTQRFLAGFLVEDES